MSSDCEDTAADKMDESRRGQGTVKNEPGVQALLTHEVTARKKTQQFSACVFFCFYGAP